jgi:hypothetical protein
MTLRVAVTLDVIVGQLWLRSNVSSGQHAADLGVWWSRLSESNRRPSHYE